MIRNGQFTHKAIRLPVWTSVKLSHSLKGESFLGFDAIVGEFIICDLR